MSIYNHLYIHVKKKKQKKRLTATQQQQQMWQQGPHGPMHHQSFTTQVTGCHHADDSVYHAGTPHHAGEIYSHRADDMTALHTTQVRCVYQ